MRLPVRRSPGCTVRALRAGRPGPARPGAGRVRDVLPAAAAPTAGAAAAVRAGLGPAGGRGMTVGPDPRVAVVVITHQRRDELLGALARLRALPEQPHVVVVDNGSTDGTADAVRARFPEVELIASPVNLGAVGRNLGVARLDTPYVAFCDDDTWWDPGSLTPAADMLDRHPRLAVVTARIVVEPGGHRGPDRRRAARLPRARRGLAARPGAGLASWPGPACCGARRSPRSAASPSGCGWAARRSCMAGDLAAAGWELCYLPELTVHHQASRARDPHKRRRRRHPQHAVDDVAAPPAAAGAAPDRAPAAPPVPRDRVTARAPGRGPGAAVGAARAAGAAAARRGAVRRWRRRSAARPPGATS